MVDTIQHLVYNTLIAANKDSYMKTKTLTPLLGWVYEEVPIYQLYVGDKVERENDAIADTPIRQKINSN